MTATSCAETDCTETKFVESPVLAPSCLPGDLRRILLAALALHFAVLSLAVILTQATLPLDVVEQISWARNPEWAYFKHPPLPAWCLAALMTLTGGKPWITALAGPAATTLALWLVWLLARRILDPVRALLSVLILEGVIHFNALSPEFNHNIVQLPLWAFIAYASHRAIRENGIADWLLLGFAAALGMYGKYSTALLLISIAAYAMYDPTARRRLTEKGPWIAIVTAGVLFLPHAIQVYSVYDLYPLRFPLDRVKKAASFADHLLFPAGWLLAQLWFATSAIILAALLFRVKDAKTALPQTEVKTPDRLFILFLFCGPFLLAAAMQAFDGVRFKDMWGCPMLDLLGLALFAFPAATPITEKGIKRFAAGWLFVFCLATTVIVVLNTVQPYFLQKGVRVHFPAQATSNAIGAAWSAQTSRPLSVVIGDNWLAGLLSTYHPDRPSILIDGQMWKSPWISKEKLSRDGAVLIWGADSVRSRLLAEFPDAIEQPELVLPFVTQASVQPARIGWAILPPQRQDHDSK
jgi:4-amino-4-deoxy-L-arabinose transferase-like glycosyltransferase